MTRDLMQSLFLMLIHKYADLYIVTDRHSLFLTVYIQIVLHKALSAKCLNSN